MLNKLLLMLLVFTLSVTTISCGRSSDPNTDENSETIDEKEDDQSDDDESDDLDSEGNKSGENFGGSKTPIESDENTDGESTNGESGDGTDTPETGNNDDEDGGTDGGSDDSDETDESETLVPVGKKRISGAITDPTTNVKVTVGGQEFILGPDSGHDTFKAILDKNLPANLVVNAIDSHKICYIENPTYLEDKTVDGLKVKCIDDLTMNDLFSMYDNALIDCLKIFYYPHSLSKRASSISRLVCNADTFDSAEGLQHFVNVREISFSQATKPDPTTPGGYMHHGITELDLSANVNLKEINLIQIHNITSINFSKNLLLEKFTTGLIYLDELDMSGLKNLWYIHLDQARLLKVDLSETPNLTYFALTNNNGKIPYHPINNPDVFKFAHPEKLTELLLYGSSIENFDSRLYTNLERLDISYSPMVNSSSSGIHTIDFSSNPKLKYLRLKLTHYIEYNFSALTALETIDIGNSRLDTLDLSNNNNLRTLYIDDNFQINNPIIYPNDPSGINIIE
ncbi:MAG: hypothetical protein OXE99_04290 [Cellvibrionales bacterium]|nr:hypothetical protein [Cellvibrionales bacterium]